MIDLRMQIISSYGEEYFYKELERFYKFHRQNNGVIHISEELGIPVKAVYIFPPITLAYEHEELMDKIREICRNEKE